MLRNGLIASGLVLILGGCTSETVRKDLDDGMRRTVAAMEENFENGRAEQFLERFAPGAFADIDEFNARVSDFVLMKRQIKIKVAIDELTTKENSNEVSARLRWDRSFIDEDGSRRVDHRRCELIMTKVPFRGLLVTTVRGDWPF